VLEPRSAGPAESDHQGRPLGRNPGFGSFHLSLPVFDEVFERAPRLQLTNVRRMLLVEKPRRMAAEAEGDTLYRAAWFDGQRLSVLNKEENTYMTMAHPPTLDAALDKLAADYGVEVPLTDFVYSDPYAVLSEGVLYGEYLGIHRF
jgi:hypothetical protein